MVEILVCQFCCYFTHDDKLLVRHIVRRHKHSGKISFRCNICGAVFKNQNSYRAHKFRKHQNTNDFQIGLVEEIPELGDLEPDERNNVSVQKFIEANYILKLKEKHGLSDEIIRDIMLTTSDLIETYSANNIPLNPRSLFEGLETSHKRDLFYKTEMSYIPPVTILVGNYNQARLNEPIQNKPAFSYYVPFLDSLKNLLKLPELEEYLSNPQPEQNADMMTDIFCGEEIKLKCPNHEINVIHLMISLYLDDLEIANPIGAHAKKHKVTVFYWQLLNLPPYLRSKLTSIQLLAVGKQKDLKKFGLDNLLSGFTKEMQEFSSGVKFVLNGNERVVKGKLAFVLGDTLASQEIGGFKEGVGNAFKFCRTCEVSRPEIQQCTQADAFVLRDSVEHNDRVESLNNCSKKAKIYWSKQWGVNKKSPFSEIPDFEVTKDLLHDPMHVLLEGVVKYETKLLLDYFIYDLKLFTLAQLNYAIQSFFYQKNEMDVKPSLIEKNQLRKKGGLKQTASAMKTLLFLMPLYIGDFVPKQNVHWITFIRLTQITQICFSSLASYKTSLTLQCLIAEHNENFQIIYPDASIIPKIHYLLHFPDQMKNYGPLRYHSCMRMESKHSYFKNKKWRCFKDVPKTMALKHQRWLCLQQSNGSGGKNQNFFGDLDNVKEGYDSEISAEIKALLYYFDENAINAVSMHISPAIIIYGHLYAKDTVLLQTYTEECGPTFMVVVEVISINLTSYVICLQLEIDFFDSHLNRYVSKRPLDGRKILIPIKKLKYKWPQISHFYNGKFYVMLYNSPNLESC